LDVATLKRTLMDAAASDDPIGGYFDLVEALEGRSSELSCVRAILEFLEEHQDADVGTPGPLVHFVERFYGNGYEGELLSSLERRRTSDTVWMLHRIINGTTDASAEVQYWAALRAAAAHDQADDAARREIAGFLAAAPSKGR
jgi:hypothetical protein